MEKLLHVGLDVGSTTVKIVIMDENLNTIYTDYQRHFSDTKNTVCNVLTDLAEKYEGKPESYFESFKKLQEVNRYVKSICTLRREAVMYQRYLAYSSSGSIYNPENIQQQLQYLLDEINSAILLLREET